MIYLDSCVVIYAVEPGPWSEVVLDAISRTAESFAISPLVCLECLVGPLKSNDEATGTRFEQFFSKVSMVPMGAEVFRVAAAHRAHRGLRTPDALHLAAAQLSGCTSLWTNDGQLASAAGPYAVVMGEASIQ